jgi:hypothetical protein
MSEIFEVMPFLANPQRQAEDERRQALARASFSRARLSPASRMISRGRQIETVARKVIKKGIGNVETAQRQLAHGLHMQGRNAEAVEVAPDELMQTHYSEIQDAIELDDALCACPRKEVEDPLTKQTLHISPRRHLKDVYSPKHSEVVALMGCDACGMRNARPLTGQAREIAMNVTASHKTVSDTRKKVLTDAQVLKEKES